MNKNQRLPHDLSCRLRTLEVMEQITQTSLASADMEDVLRGVLDLVLEVFNADRAWFLYPCDPDAPSWGAPMERTRPEWPGLFAQGVDMPMDHDAAKIFSEILKASGAIQYGPDTDYPLPPLVAEHFSLKSQVTIALRPKIGSPWMFGLHHCASAIKHDENDLQLFTAIAYRIADTLSVLLSNKQLLESEARIQAVADFTLQQSERQLKEAQSIAHIGSWDYNLATGQLTWSDELYRIYGVSPDTFMPCIETLINLIHPDDKLAMESWIEACATGKKPNAWEFRCIWPDGRIRYIEGQGQLILDPEGKPSHASGTAQDITERKLAEMRLQESERRLQASQAIGHVGTWDWNTVSGELIWSDETYRILGFTPGEVTPSYDLFLNVLPPDDQDRLNMAVEMALHKHQPYNIDCRVLRKDGSERVANAQGEVEFDTAGKPVRMLGIFQDITERKQTEIALQLSETRLVEAQSISKLGSWNLDLINNKVIWSDEVYRIFGLEHDEFGASYEAFLEVVHPDDRDLVNTAYTESVKNKTPYDLVHRLLLKDGTLKYVNAKCQTYYDADGTPLRSIGTTQDITERKQIEDELFVAKQAEQANRLKNEFLGRMSHELRTPLNAILGFAQIMELSDDEETLGAHRDDLKTMARSGWHLLRIIQDLLNLSEIEAGKVSLHMEKIDVRGSMIECFELLTPLAKEHGIEIGCEAGACEGIIVWADPFRLKQVFTNLLANAIKYNRVNGSVTVSGQRVQDRLRILISDTGLGIPENEFASLFQPFSRIVERPYTIEGAGIGLSIAKQLTELMGGTIGIESVLGQGSTFWIELPVAEAQNSFNTPVNGPVSLNDHSATTGKQTTLLCIEDNTDHIKLIEAIVSKMENSSLLTAPTPSLGLDLARTHKPDLILLDIGLPDMNGYEVLERLQADERTRHIPVIAVSASAYPVEIEKGLQAGFRCYLTKPLNVVEFKNTVAELLLDAV